MELCPQCNAELVLGENFCDNCGHKHASNLASPEPQPEQQIESQTQDVSESSDVSEQTTDPSGIISIQDDDGTDITSIYFEDTPKTIGRQDVSDFLNSQNMDPLQVSRKQCTIFREGDDYYIEDGTTSVQDKPSGNHTTVNGQDITGQGKTKLGNNDKIIFATVVNAVFHLG